MIQAWRTGCQLWNSYTLSVTWDKLEAMLQLGDKYGMHVFVQRFSNFIESEAKELVLEADSKLFVCNGVPG